MFSVEFFLDTHRRLCGSKQIYFKLLFWFASAGQKGDHSATSSRYFSVPVLLRMLSELKSLCSFKVAKLSFGPLNCY